MEPTNQNNTEKVQNTQNSSIINQSKELSVTTCVIAVDYRESIPRVELVIKNNLDRIKKAIPEIVDGPYYKGVDSLGDSSVNLLFIATVKENDYYVVQRALNRELKLIFDENNISIPFPQVTINEPEEFAKKANATDTKKANEFAKKQSNAAKHYKTPTNKPNKKSAKLGALFLRKIYSLSWICSSEKLLPLCWFSKISRARQKCI